MKNYLIIILAIIVHASCNGQKIKKQTIFKNLQKQYNFSNDFKKYKVAYKTIRLFPHQSYDYKKPEDPVNGYRKHNTEIDLENEQYFSHDISYYPGGFIFDFVHFQKDSLIISYDVNGVLLGKKVEVGERTFKSVKKRATVFLDFMNVLNLLARQRHGDITEVNTYKEKNEVIIKQINQDSVANKYTFSLMPLRLISIENSAKKTKTVFSNFKVKNDISFAHNIDVYRGEKVIRDYEIENLTKLSQINPSKLVIPNGYVISNKKEIKKSKIQLIAKDLYLFTTPDYGRNILIKVVNKSIMVFGAPVSDKISETVISLIKKKFPLKKIKYVYVTHPHSDHISGLKAYVKQNITILADNYTIAGIKAFPKFKKDLRQFKFSAIKNNQTLNNIRFYIPKNSHSVGQSFAYFKEAQIIYEGDFLEVPFDNTIPTYMSKVEQEFVEFVRKEKLKIKRIVGNHRNANISLETMNKYYNSNIKL